MNQTQGLKHLVITQALHKNNLSQTYKRHSHRHSLHKNRFVNADKVLFSFSLLNQINIYVKDVQLMKFTKMNPMNE